jgi:hypothetical protein
MAALALGESLPTAGESAGANTAGITVGAEVCDGKCWGYWQTERRDEKHELR